MANAAIRLNHGRSNPLVMEQVITFDQMSTTAVGVVIGKLPVGAIITGGSVNVETASDIGTSGSVALVHNSVTLATGVDVKTAAATALTAASCNKAPASAQGNVTLTPTLVGGAATTGQIRVLITYVISGRADEAQP